LDWEYFLDKHCGQPEKTLFHYTALRGFYGILDDNCLWATDTRYLNDLEEYRHGVALFKEELKRVAERIENHNFLVNYPECIDDLLNVGTRLNGKHTYCVSFTENGNLLSQWRGYAGNGGLSIGFDPKSLTSSAKNQGFRFMKCLYNEKEKEAFVHEVVDDFLWHCDEWHNYEALDHFTPTHFGVYLRSMVCFFAPFLKHEAFFEEKEWRAVHSYSRLPNEMLFSRKSHGVDIPYTVLSLQGVSIRKIYFGPCNNLEKVYLCILHAFDLSELFHVCEKSGIPYRGSL
jgi:hypothetical protein